MKKAAQASDIKANFLVRVAASFAANRAEGAIKWAWCNVSRRLVAPVVSKVENLGANFLIETSSPVGPSRITHTLYQNAVAFALESLPMSRKQFSSCLLGGCRTQAFVASKVGNVHRFLRV